MEKTLAVNHKMATFKSFEYGLLIYIACAVIINNSHGNIINSDEVAVSIGNTAAGEQVNLGFCVLPLYTHSKSKIFMFAERITKYNA